LLKICCFLIFVILSSICIWGIHLVQTIEAPLPAADVAELPIEFVATIFAITDDPFVNEKGADLRTDIGIEH
jgi:hypothetical protein